MFHILWMIIVGFFVGLIARGLLPGADTMGFWLTALVGIIGSVVGGLIGNMIWKPKPDTKFHPAGLFMSLVGSILILVLMRQFRA